MRTALWTALFALSAVAGPARAADREAFTKACLSSSNMGQPICECCAQKAEQRLSPLGFEFLVAMLAKDDAKTDALRAKMSVAETLKAGMFMTNTPAECAKERGGP